MRAKATKTVAAQNMARRAEQLLAGLEAVRAVRQGRQAALPRARALRQDPADGRRACRSRTARWRSSPTSTWRSTGAPGSSSSGLNGAGKTTLLRLLGGVEKPDTGEVEPGHGLKLGYYAQEHETLDPDRTVLENMRSAAPDLDLVEVRKILGSFLFSGDDVDKPAGVLSGGEKTRLALATLVVSSANVLLLDEPTNNLDPASREEILGALRTYARRRRPGHPRRGRGRGAPAGADHPAARTASRTCGARTTWTWSRSPDRPVRARLTHPCGPVRPPPRAGRRPTGRSVVWIIRPIDRSVICVRRAHPPVRRCAATLAPDGRAIGLARPSYSLHTVMTRDFSIACGPAGNVSVRNPRHAAVYPAYIAER